MEVAEIPRVRARSPQDLSRLTANALSPLDGPTTMQHAKHDALEAIGKLPDDADMDEIMYRLYVLDKIRKGQEAVASSRITSSEDLEREIDSW